MGAVVVGAEGRLELGGGVLRFVEDAEERRHWGIGCGAQTSDGREEFHGSRVDKRVGGSGEPTRQVVEDVPDMWVDN